MPPLHLRYLPALVRANCSAHCAQQNCRAYCVMAGKQKHAKARGQRRVDVGRLSLYQAPQARRASRERESAASLPRSVRTHARGVARGALKRSLSHVWVYLPSNPSSTDHVCVGCVCADRVAGRKGCDSIGGCPSLGGDRRVERSGVVDYLNILSPLGVSTWCNRREGRELRETRISCRDAKND